DAEAAGILRHIQAEVLVQRVLVALEETLYEGFIHDGDRRRGLVIGDGEAAPAEELHAEILKIICAHPVPGCATVLLEFGLGMPGYEDQLAPVVGERVV